MYWYRVLRKVHRPLIAIAIIGMVIVTASNCEMSVDKDEEHRDDLIDSLSDKELLLKSVAAGGSSSKQQGVPLLGSTSPVPSTPVLQLPYCRNNQDRSHFKTGRDGNEGGHEGGNSSSSDEVAVTNTGRLKVISSGRSVLVATLDGQLSLLDHRGRVLWSVSTGQLLSSTISSLQLNENGKWINLIPSLTGGLYKYDGNNLQPMPVNAETLLRRSFKLSNDVVMTGGKELRTFGIDLASGKLRYECGLQGCVTPAETETHVEGEDLVLVVKKQLQTVRAIDSASGSERWNFSVATHELALAGITEGCYEAEQKDSSPDHLIKVVIPEGLIMGADESNHSVWQHKFGSPISQAWVLEKGRLKVIDPITHSALLEESPALYIGMHKQQFYVQESHSTAEKLENAFAIQFAKRDIPPKPVEIGWKPSTVIEGMQDNRALTMYHPEFFGFYIFEKEEVQNKISSIEDVSGKGYFRSDSSDSDKTFDFTAAAMETIIVSLWMWWKEVLGISLLTAVIVHVLVLRPMIRAERTQMIRELWATIRNSTAVKEEEMALVPRKQSDTLELPSSISRTRTRTTSSSSTTSQVAALEDQSVPFVSQYLREFDPIQCLGRGGFGVVFEARKKIDDRHYAVKRIPLPNHEKSRDKVMREVKALAKLDHRNIVRYFNAWIENPPPGWLESNDPLWILSKEDASSANYLSSYEATANRKRDYSEISMPSKTPVDESVEPEDSFIVFAAGGDHPSKTQDDHSMTESENDCWEVTGKAQRAPLLPYTIQESFLNTNENTSASISHGGGFFVRPTSLDIPSFTEDSQGKDVEEVGGGVNDSGVVGSACGPPTIMYLYIQQELCQKRTLQEWLRKTKERNLLQIIHYFAQIVEAVEYIHLNKLIHRDLKPGNIFLASSVDSGISASDEEMTVKIGDFGLATTAVSRFDGEAMTPDGENIPVRVNLTGQVGTHLYMSPEQSKKLPYDFKVDIYSLGLIFFELLVPFSTEMERHDALSRVRKMNFPPSFCSQHSEEYHIISLMVAHDPKQRPTAGEIKNWVKDHILNLSSATANYAVSSSRGVPSITNSYSADSPLYPGRMGLKRFHKEEKLLHKAQSCS